MRTGEGVIVYGDLDTYIVPILKHLWSRGVITRFSCAGHEDNYRGCYLVFKHDEDFINYLWDSNLAIERHPDIDGGYQYIIRSSNYLSDGFYSKTMSKKQKEKLIRDRFLLILSRYKK